MEHVWRQHLRGPVFTSIEPLVRRHIIPELPTERAAALHQCQNPALVPIGLLQLGKRWAVVKRLLAVHPCLR